MPPNNETVQVDGQERTQVQPMEYRLYRRRWFMLLVVCILNISNAMLWICFSPIANYSDSFYCNQEHCNASDMLSMVFMIIAIPVGFIAMWSVDKYGLRTGILLGSWVNAAGAAIRVISSIPQLQDSSAKYPIVLTGQCIAACAQPFIMYLPTKLAALWFPDGQRTVANTFGSMSNPLGILMAMSISPAIVNSASGSQILLLNLVLFAPCALVAFMATFGVCSSVPPTPPTSSAASVSPPFFPGLKLALRNRPFLVLILCLGNGVGVFNAVYTLIQQFLCPKGYDNSFVGLCGSLLIVGGLLGSVVAGVIVDRTKWFEQVAKISYSIAAVVSCAFALLSLRPHVEVPLAVSVTLFGAAGFAIYPLGLEMGVECTYPVAEATSSGLLIIAGQIFGIIYVLLMSALAGPASNYDMSIEKCTAAEALSVQPQDWTVPVLIMCGAASFAATLFVVAFWPKFKRMEAERQLIEQAKKLLQAPPPQQQPVAEPSAEPTSPGKTVRC